MWRAWSASLIFAAAIASLSATCGGNSSRFFEPSMKWITMPRLLSLIVVSPGSHRLELAAAQRHALPDLVAVAVAALERAALAHVHRHRDLVVGLAQARLHLGGAGGAEAPALARIVARAPAERGHGADHRPGVEALRAAGGGALAARAAGGADLADRADLAAHQAGLRPGRQCGGADAGGERALHSPIAWM